MADAASAAVTRVRHTATAQENDLVLDCAVITCRRRVAPNACQVRSCVRIGARADAGLPVTNHQYRERRKGPERSEEHIRTGRAVEIAQGLLAAEPIVFLAWH